MDRTVLCWSKRRLPGCERRLLWKEPSKLDKAFAKNFGSAEATAKILTKTAKITANPTTWKNPIYFWSVAGTAALFLPILWYAASK